MKVYQKSALYADEFMINKNKEMLHFRHLFHVRKEMQVYVSQYHLESYSTYLRSQFQIRNSKLLNIKVGLTVYGTSGLLQTRQGSLSR